MVEKVAVVTAGGSGMGAAAARKLAQQGFKVAVLSSSGKGEALAKELGGVGVTGSNRSNDDLKRLFDQTMKSWGCRSCESRRTPRCPRGRCARELRARASPPARR